MDNYKIKVKDEAENVDIQKAFFALGYGWSTDRKKEITTSQDMIDDGYSSNYKIAFIYAGNDGRLLNSDDSADGYRSYVESDAKELSLSELLELVAAKEPQDQGLISGAEAKLAWAKGKDVQTATLPILHEQSCWIDLHGGFGLDVFDDNEDRVFRLKPTTLTVNAELPKPSNTTLHNQNYSVTYEFKNREDRNAFVEGLGGNNS